MKSGFKYICIAALLASSASQAYQADITVTADIDPTAGITKANGDSLPATVALNYNPLKGLEAYKQDVKLWTNDEYDMKVRLQAEPKLTDTSGQNPIDLSVTLGKADLGVQDTVYNYSEIFPAGTDNGSMPLALVIKPKTPGKISTAGKYSGLVSLIVSQATTKDGAAPNATPTP
ncbi:CS1 type fimbrial major subunit [Pantoea stewartii]|uniref:Fimbrial assembly protein n=1 Tax=Pantoea stewartii TaxID=66269 RepID=A0AB34VFR8_9GAMM|nr:CS1 type fimbrial major subunit [Pantoea stewartii]KTS72231.1 hypothetical protein RSA30_15535 [Pantoea stewartii]KTS97659.1 hypothetical protein RSA13_11235 [Pantoea stewartii]KTT05816.1 hypothetical protein RSA36_19440 [Pantoea stewartii]